VTQRNDCLKLRLMLDSGELRIHDLRSVAIEHGPLCQQRITARNLVCDCDPEIWVATERKAV
jgi:hypothetical protein